MLSFRYKFLYVHVGKTGGNSVTAALAPFSDDRIEFRNSVGHIKNEDGKQGIGVFNDALGFVEEKDKHATYSRYVEVLGDRINELFVFTSIRNPFDRCVSATAFKRGELTRKLSAREVVVPRPQVLSLSLNGVLAVRHYIRFENMQPDFDRVCDQLGLPRLALPHKNASHRSADYRDHLDETALDRIRHACEADFTAFGYDM